MRISTRPRRRAAAIAVVGTVLGLGLASGQGAAAGAPAAAGTRTGTGCSGGRRLARGLQVRVGAEQPDPCGGRPEQPGRLGGRRHGQIRRARGSPAGLALERPGLAAGHGPRRGRVHAHRRGRSAPSDLWIFAVPGQGGRAKAMRWDGTSWRAIRLPAGVFPGDAAVLSPANAWVVGPQQPCTGSGASRVCPTTMYHWNGSRWTASLVPVVVDQLSGSALAAAGSGQAWVAGALRPCGGPPCSYRVAVYRWTGSGWARAPGFPRVTSAFLPGWRWPHPAACGSAPGRWQERTRAGCCTGPAAAGTRSARRAASPPRPRW